MFIIPKKAISILIFIISSLILRAQPVDFNGQGAGWVTANNSGGFGLQTGVRYIPQLLFKISVKENYSFDAEFSADSYLNYSILPDTNNIFDAKASLYRFWLRFAGERFEIRAGLQKINFGSASMLRPLMWFDRIDPRDPLKLTKGVYGILGKYYFKNNTNIWLWMLYGNKDTKGWEVIPTRLTRPEFGGRMQFPVPKGELALSYHNRIAEFPDDWQPPVSGNRYFPENRFGFDFKLDLGVGLWFEGSVTHQKQDELPPFTRAVTIGVDYTFGIGNGLNITAEHLVINASDKLFSNWERLSFTGIALGIPLSVITRASTIVFYDWKNKGFYRFANLSFTFDNLAFNIIGFWNPGSFRIFNYTSGPNMFAGAGGQFMVVYNY